MAVHHIIPIILKAYAIRFGVIRQFSSRFVELLSLYIPVRAQAAEKNISLSASIRVKSSVENEDCSFLEGMSSDVVIVICNVSWRDAVQFKQYIIDFPRESLELRDRS